MNSHTLKASQAAITITSTATGSRIFNSGSSHRQTAYMAASSTDILIIDEINRPMVKFLSTPCHRTNYIRYAIMS